MEEGTSKKKIFLVTGGVVLILAVAAVFVLPPRVSAYYTAKSRYAFNAGDVDSARRYAEKAIVWNRSNPTAYAYLGRIALGEADPKGPVYYPNADYEKAVEYYEKAFSLDLEAKHPGAYAQALDNSGIAYRHLERYEKANENRLKLIKIAPDRSFVWRYSVAEDYFLRANKPKEALELLLPAADPDKTDDPDNLYRVYILLSRLSWYFGDGEDTEGYAKLALDNLPANPLNSDVQIIHYALALAAGKNKNFALAEKEMGLAKKLGASPQADCVLAQAYYYGGAYKKAIGTAVKVEKPKADSYTYSLCLGALAKSSETLGKMADAKKYFEEYISQTDEIDPKNIFTVRGREEAEKAMR